MKKKIIIITSSLVAILLLAILLVVLNNSYTPKKELPKEVNNYKEPEIKKLKLKSIYTEDKKIKINDTIAYFTPDNGISQVDLEINSKNSLNELILLIEFELEDKIESKFIYQNDVNANKEFKYIIQSEEDLTKTKKWKVSKLTEEEALLKGYIKIED